MINNLFIFNLISSSNRFPSQSNCQQSTVEATGTTPTRNKKSAEKNLLFILPFARLRNFNDLILLEQFHNHLMFNLYFDMLKFLNIAKRFLKIWSILESTQSRYLHPKIQQLSNIDIKFEPKITLIRTTTCSTQTQPLNFDSKLETSSRLPKHDSSRLYGCRRRRRSNTAPTRNRVWTNREIFVKYQYQ